MKVAIIGSRNCMGLTAEEIVKYVPIVCTSIVSGGADGVDTLAVEAAKLLSVPIQVIRPDYKLFGKNAPIFRNRQIVEAADMVLAFWDYSSKGTRNAILEALKLSKPVKVFILSETGKIRFLQDDVGLIFNNEISQA